MEKLNRCWLSWGQNIKNSKLSRMNSFYSIMLKFCTIFPWIKSFIQVKYQFETLKGVVPTRWNVLKSATFDISFSWKAFTTKFCTSIAEIKRFNHVKYQFETLKGVVPTRWNVLKGFIYGKKKWDIRCRKRNYGLHQASHFCNSISDLTRLRFWIYDGKSGIYDANLKPKFKLKAGLLISAKTNNL